MKEEIKKLERLLIEKHPNWPAGKARWLVKKALMC